MRVLIDECTPRALKKLLMDHGHECHQRQPPPSSKDRRFAFQPSLLLEKYVFVTVDTNLRYQQNLTGRQISIVILRSSSNRVELLRLYFPACVLAIEKIKPGDVVHVGRTN